MKNSSLFISRIPGYVAAKAGINTPPPPVNLTFSITEKCNSSCRTCGIGKNGITGGSELDLSQIERFLSTTGRVSFFNISGGEPFLRDDLPEICTLAAKLVQPDVIHIPTNAILTEKIIQTTEEICRRVYPVRVTVKPSMDGIGQLHDEIRGVKGNFEKLMDTFNGLVDLKKRARNLEIGLGTVISRFNVHRMDEILELVEELSPDSYITEVAEEREEMTNIGSDITPSATDYGLVLEKLRRFTLSQQASAPGVGKLTLAFRAVYYDLTYRWLLSGARSLPCWAGITNAHVAPDGEVWACCVLAGSEPMGHLLDTDMRFDLIWSSPGASRVRRRIARGMCACPLANQSYANIVLSPSAASRAAMHMAMGRIQNLIGRHRDG